MQSQTTAVSQSTFNRAVDRDNPYNKFTFTRDIF